MTASVDDVVAAALAVIEQRGVDVVKHPAEAAAVAGETAARLVGADAQTIRSVQERVAPFGPLQRLLDDPTIEEIWWNRPDRIMVARAGISTVSDVRLTDDQVVILVERMLRSSGRRLDLSKPAF